MPGLSVQAVATRYRQYVASFVRTGDLHAIGLFRKYENVLFFYKVKRQQLWQFQHH